MTALGKLFRTTAFKLTLVYLTTFVLFAAAVLLYFASHTRRLITEQIERLSAALRAHHIAVRWYHLHDYKFDPSLVR